MDSTILAVVTLGPPALFGIAVALDQHAERRRARRIRHELDELAERRRAASRATHPSSSRLAR